MDTRCIIINRPKPEILRDLRKSISKLEDQYPKQKRLFKRGPSGKPRWFIGGESSSSDADCSDSGSETSSLFSEDDYAETISSYEERRRILFGLIQTTGSRFVNAWRTTTGNRERFRSGNKIQHVRRLARMSIFRNRRLVGDEVESDEYEESTRAVDDLALHRCPRTRSASGSAPSIASRSLRSRAVASLVQRTETDLPGDTFPGSKYGRKS